MSAPVKIVIAGASGYTGLKLLSLLLLHPQVEVVGITSRSNAGRTIQEVFPKFTGHPEAELAFIEPDMAALAATGAKVAFLALPHGKSARYAAQLLDHGLKVIESSSHRGTRVLPHVHYASAHPSP